MNDVVRFIRAFSASKGHAPTQAEIALGTGLTRAQVRRKLADLSRAGQVEWQPGARRTIRVKARTGNAKGSSTPI